MYTNSHLFNALACLKFFINSQQTMFFFPSSTRRIFEFFNLAWRSGIIAGYSNGLSNTDYFRNRKSTKRGLVVYIKHGRYRYDTLWLETISGSARPLILKKNDIKLQFKLNRPYVFLLCTSFGYLSSEELILFNITSGGSVICKLF